MHTGRGHEAIYVNRIRLVWGYTKIKPDIKLNSVIYSHPDPLTVTSILCYPRPIC